MLTNSQVTLIKISELDNVTNYLGVLFLWGHRHIINREAMGMPESMMGTVASWLQPGP